ESKDRFPLEHCKDLLESGQPVLMCPEGKMYRDGKVHELKNGVAWLATRANFDSVVPIAVNFEKGDASLAGPVEKAAGWLATGAVVAVGLWGSLGGPMARGLAGALAGSVAGAYVATRGDYGPDAFETMGRAAKGIAAGALSGAVAGASLPPGIAFPVLAATTLAAGVGMRQLSNLFHSRPVAEIAVGEPLKIADYRDRYGAEAGTYLRNDLQDFMATTKTDLSGIESPPAPAPTSRQASGGGPWPVPAFRPPTMPAPAAHSPALRPVGERPAKPD
ncbi:MAG: 1-acyl-sn-glycerol-3-phosphate acyltransferase, partial [Candidatus Eremiobacteraeota bacterium]|nr:1-acyl-sn-glycerol-3-phosphate acyltransferase [Candidatus Eremiobacteraeota bacterium]